MNKKKQIGFILILAYLSLTSFYPNKIDTTHTHFSVFPDGIITILLSCIGYQLEPRTTTKTIEAHKVIPDFDTIDSCTGERAVFKSTDTTIPIPISATQGGTISSYVYIPTDGDIADVIVSGLDITHTCVGDLIIRLEHKGISVLLLDNPGAPAIPFGCSENHILADFDDGANFNAENVCAISDGFAIAGTFLPMETLNAFEGVDMSGEWKLTIEDTYAFADGGSLNDWNLDICYTLPILCEETLVVTDTIPDGLYQASMLVTSLGVVTGSGAVIFSAGNCILLENGFEVTIGSEFEGIIGDCQ